eukprot:TRINITY_DN5012_c0_g1_i5.p1 TRINITY_DN5012_c0_g1~~TRINITY_DN5012_c0_g1_i5.p1  ORF type:complete len:383 (-),score=100.91 TRINITY_DN5012_c0_g1_i5:41-1189(-)
MFSVFVSAFKALPLCAVMGEEDGVFVVHAGVFRDEAVGLKEINDVQRFKYTSMLADEVITSDFHDQVIEDMTWSDPTDRVGVHQNDDRGAGIYFGPDIALGFLQRNGLKTLVRSHEALCNGCESALLGPKEVGCWCWTVFSASNYSGSGNQGAVLEFTSLGEQPKVHRYHSSAARPTEEVERGNMDKLEHYVARRHFRLLKAFQTEDKGNTDKVSGAVWESVMKQVLEMNINWALIRPTLLGTMGEPDGSVRYKQFLDNYVFGEEHHGSTQAFAVANLYDNYSLLRAVFMMWDVDHSGTVDLQEFCNGVKVLNAELKSENKIDAITIFEILDIDGSGEIDLNEFCESYRLVRRSMPNSPLSPPLDSPMTSLSPRSSGPMQWP